MNYAIILAGGTGSRMGASIPKQFLKINNTPIIIYTIKKFIKIKEFYKIIIVCNNEWLEYLNNLLIEYSLIDLVCVTKGGVDRLQSVQNGIKYINKNFGIKDDDIFVAHDSVRPFITEEIILNNIAEAKKYKAATTVVDLIETIVETNGNLLYKSYPRTHLFSGQSPQTFNIKYFMECMNAIPEEIQRTYTDLSECVFYCGGTVKPVIGDRQNIKITTPIDLIIAEQYMENRK